MKKRRTLQASINLNDPFEIGLLEYAVAQGDISKYIKRLIYVDKEGFRNVTPAPTYEPPQEDDKIRDAMKSVSL